ncbi:MAG: ribonuclease [Lachnospiraceae bacterium]|nr:ribonuclease [Lachnospiraceae bacterium]
MSAAVSENEVSSEIFLAKNSGQQVTELKLIEDEPENDKDKSGTAKENSSKKKNKSDPDNKKTDRKNSDSKTSDGKASNKKSSDSKNEDNKKSDGRDSSKSSGASGQDGKIDEKGSYDSKDEVALYIHLYGKLPSNYITKKEAQALGWSGGSLEKFAPGKCIGGSRFGNYEGKLPEKKGRQYYECDIDTLGAGQRGAKRLVYSNDGLIYYTGDHYKKFELLYDSSGKVK